MALGNTWLALSCLLACVVALWSTRTYYCMKSVALCRADWRLLSCACGSYVDTVALGAWFAPAWCAQKKKRRFENKNFVVVLLLHMAIRADTASFLREEHLPCSHVHLAVGTPQCHDLTESASVANLPRSRKHTRARFLLLAVMLLLYYWGWLWCSSN